MGDAFSMCASIMKETEEEHGDITFNQVHYNGEGIIQIKFCSASEMALRELTSNVGSFNVERW